MISSPGCIYIHQSKISQNQTPVKMAENNSASEKKRPRENDETPGLAERDSKRAKDRDGDAAPAPSNPSPGLTVGKDENMFYPETYDKFDPDCVVADGDPQNSKVGGGKILFIKYMNKERGVSYPLCVQGPKMFLPATSWV